MRPTADRLAPAFDRRGTGEPLVLLHGFGMERRVWDHLVPALVEHREVVTVDWPGHGDSPEMPADVVPGAATLAGYLLDFLDDIGLQSFHVAGVSAGGWLALEMAKSGHARSVTAICPGGLWRGRMPRYVSVSLRAVRFSTRAMRRLLPAMLSTRAGRTMVLSQVTARPWRMTRDQALLLTEGFAGCREFERILDTVVHERFQDGAGIEAPVTVAQGSRDRLMLRRQARRRDELPPHTRFVALPGCGHVPLWDDPELIIDTILAGSAPAAGVRS